MRVRRRSTVVTVVVMAIGSSACERMPERSRCFHTHASASTLILTQPPQQPRPVSASCHPHPGTLARFAHHHRPPSYITLTPILTPTLGSLCSGRDDAAACSLPAQATRGTHEGTGDVGTRPNATADGGQATHTRMIARTHTCINRTRLVTSTRNLILVPPPGLSLSNGRTHPRPHIVMLTLTLTSNPTLVITPNPHLNPCPHPRPHPQPRPRPHPGA